MSGRRDRAGRVEKGDGRRETGKGRVEKEWKRETEDGRHLHPATGLDPLIFNLPAVISFADP
jgi:hypothetical protein